MQFDNYPESCPPSDAYETTNHTVYRFLNKNESAVSLSAFRSYYDMGKTTSDPCQERGLSVFTTEEGVKQALRQVRGFRGRKVAKGILGEGMGKLKNTPRNMPNHHTWWLASDAPNEPVELFSIDNDL